MRFAVAALAERGRAAASGSTSRWSATCSAASGSAATASSARLFVCSDGPVFRFDRVAPLLACGSSDGRRRKPKLAVLKFASCDGCQLALLDCEDELLAVAERGRDRLLPRGHARRQSRARTTSRWSRARSPRRTTPSGSARSARSRAYLVTIGACATAGGIQALRNFADVDDFTASCTPPRSTSRRSPPRRRSRAHVPVDFELRGCPIDKRQLLEVITAFLTAASRAIAAHSVCVECKRRGNVCVMVAHGTPCLGPVTHAGCGAICPAYDRGCYGCFGPKETPNTASLSRLVAGARRRATRDLVRVFRTFNAAPSRSGEESEAP